MYPTLHIYLHRLSPLVCLQHHPCFSFWSIQTLSSELPFSFSYFTHIFAHGSHFPLLPSPCMPSIIHGVTNYLPIIFHTDIRSQSSLVYDRDFYIAIVLFVVHGGFFFFFFFECSSREKKNQIESTSCGFGMCRYNRLFRIERCSHPHHPYYGADYGELHGKENK